jgi:predicted HTH transcriptional regulator
MHLGLQVLLTNLLHIPAYVKHSAITNAEIRSLFGLTVAEKAKSSRLIKETIKQGLIKPIDAETAPRYMKYIPFWA